MEVWNNHIYNGCKKKNRWNRFLIEREQVRKDYTTRIGENRTGYVVRDKFVYEVECKVEM